MNTSEINELCVSYNKAIRPYFRGVFAKDSFLSYWSDYLIPEDLNLYIVNSENSGRPGKHWVLFAKLPHQVKENWVFFDSYNKPLSFYGIYDRYAEIVAPYRVQGRSKVCGFYSVFIAFELANGKHLESCIRARFSQADLDNNDRILISWFIDKGYQEPLEDNCFRKRNNCLSYQELLRQNGKSGDDR